MKRGQHFFFSSMVTYLIYKVCASENCDSPNYNMKAVMIANTNISRLDLFRTTFSSRIFANVSIPKLEVELFPFEISQNCQLNSKVEKEFYLDIYFVPNVAHYKVWEQFNRTHVNCADKLIVFQHDAAIGHSNAGSIVVEHVKSMREDIMFFGFCFKSFGIPKFLKRRRFIKYHPKATGLAPHCLHAYALTVNGAEKLTRLLNVCGPAADIQIAELANKGLLTYKYSNISYDPEFIKLEFATYGVHWKDDQYDGIFPRIVLDDVIPSLPDGTACHDLGQERSVFILQHQIWRRIPNVEMYDVIIGSAKNAVKVLTSWQFHHYPVGLPLTEKDVANITALRIANAVPIRLILG